MNTKTVTIQAKDQGIYVGGEIPSLVGTDFYTVTGLVGEETLTTNPTLVYQQGESKVTPDNTTAGTYDIVPSGAAASDNYSISYTNGTLTISNKGTQTITAENVTVTYGDTGKSVSATVTEPATGGGDISYAVKDGSGDYIDVNASTGALTIKKVGSATVIVTAAETATYAQATKEVTVTINKANAVAATVTANNRTYDGTAQPLVTVTGETTGGTLKFAVTTEDQEPAADAYNLDTTSIPTATNDGTYYVWYKAVGNENYNDSKADVVTVTIKPSVTVTFDSNGGSEVDPQVIDKGGKAEEPEEPTNGKLAFIGWFVKPTIENLYDFDNEKISSFNFYSAIDEDTTLTAVWAAFARVNTIGTGKVNYAYEGEEKDDEYDDSIILSAIQGMADTFILTAKADEGSRFVKWQKVIEEGETVEDSTFEDYSEDEEITITITEPISLVAVFETIDEDDKVYSSYESDTEWTMGSGKSLKVGAKGSKDDDETINHFTGIKCNGKEIAKKYYTAKKGSVIIEIDPEYLETLEAGKHVLTLMFDDADDLDIEFTVLAAEEDDSKDDTSKDAKIDVDTDTADTGKTTGSNTDSSARTGDNTQILLALFIMIDSALALNYLMIKKRKSRKN